MTSFTNKLATTPSPDVPDARPSKVGPPTGRVRTESESCSPGVAVHSHDKTSRDEKRMESTRRTIILQINMVSKCLAISVSYGVFLESESALEHTHTRTHVRIYTHTHTLHQNYTGSQVLTPVRFILRSHGNQDSRLRPELVFEGPMWHLLFLWLFQI